MDTGALSFIAGGPDIAAVVLDDLPHDGQADAAAPLGRVPGGVRAVEPLKDFGQILLGYALAVVLNLNADGFPLIHNADIYDPMRFIHIFYTVADDIIDHFLHLFRVSNHHRVRLYQIGVVEHDIFLFQFAVMALAVIVKLGKYIIPHFNIAK